MAIYSDVFVIDGVEIPQPDEGFSPVAKIDGVLLEPPEGKGWVIVGGLPWAGDAYSVLEDADPPAKDGDVIEWDEETSPGGFRVTMRSDGTFVLSDDDDGTLQTFQYRLWRPGSGWTAAKTVTLNGESSGGTPYQADLQPASLGVAAAPVWVETVTPYAAELQPAAFGMSARQVVYREVLNYAADLAAATFSASARAVSWAMGHVAMLAAAAFGAGAKAVSWAGAVIAGLQPASMKAKARDAQYSTALSYVAELTAALFKSSAADVAVILAYVAQIKSAIFSLRARAASITGGGVPEVVRRLIGKTWRRRGRRL